MTPTTTHAPRPADIRGITFCGRPNDAVTLATWGTWPTCPACASGVKDNPRMAKALGLSLKETHRG
jgi:hypothetical protein